MQNESNNLKNGQNYASIIEIFGLPDLIKSSISNGKEKKKIYYGKSLNRLGNESYSLEISLIDEKLVGYRHLSAVGKNSSNL